MCLRRKNKERYKTYNVKSVGVQGGITTPKYNMQDFDKYVKTFDKECRRLIRNGAADKFTLSYMNDEIDSFRDSSKAGVDEQRQEHVRIVQAQETLRKADEIECERVLQRKKEDLELLRKKCKEYEDAYYNRERKVN